MPENNKQIVPKFIAKSSDKELVALIHKHFSDNILEFLQECITEDSHDNKNPWKPLPLDKIAYISTVATAFVKYHKLIIVKSRQVMISWVLMCCLLWDIMFHKGVRNAVVSKKAEDARRLIERAEFVYKKLGPWKPKLEFIYHPLPRVYCEETHSFLFGFPQGADQLRGDTFTRIFSDEFAFQEDQDKTYIASKPTIDGGGNFIAVSTPNGQNNLFYRLSRDPSFHRLDIHWSMNPLKDAKWQKEAFSGLSEQARQQEYELNFLAAQTDRIYDEFAYTAMVKSVEFNEAHPLLVGWDGGYKRPAVVFAQLYNDRFFVLGSCLGYKQVIHDFTYEILRLQKEWFPNVGKVFDFGDPALMHNINTQTGKPDLDILNDILKEYGRQCLYVESKDCEIGHNILRRFMRSQVKGESSFIVSPEHQNIDIIEGFMGGYHYHGTKERICGCSETEPGTKELEFYKHKQDCIRYILLNMYADHGAPIAVKQSALPAHSQMDKRFYGRRVNSSF